MATTASAAVPPSARISGADLGSCGMPRCDSCAHLVHPAEVTASVTKRESVQVGC